MKRLIKRGKNWLKRNRAFLVFRKYRLLSKFIGKNASRKVIMFRLDLIGDCTMFTSAAKAIREIYEDREMTIVCLSNSRFVFERLGVFDRIICVDFNPHQIDYKKLRHVIKELRQDTYDLLLQPQISRYPLADILGAAVKVNKRIAIEAMPGNSSPDWINKVNCMYDEFISYPRDAVSEFDFYATFVRGLGYPEYKITRPCLSYGTQKFVEGKYYVLYPGGSLPYKLWPAERFAQLANYIYQKTGLIGVILGASSDQKIADTLKEHLDFVTSLAIVNLTGMTSIGDVIDIIGNAQFVISNDTSGVHIACATNTPSVVNVGGWHFNRFLPYQLEDVKPEDNLPLVAYVLDIVGSQNEECLRRLQWGEPCDCVNRVKVDDMRKLVDQIIAKECL